MLQSSHYNSTFQCHYISVPYYFPLDQELKHVAEALTTEEINLLLSTPFSVIYQSADANQSLLFNVFLCYQGLLMPTKPFTRPYQRYQSSSYCCKYLSFKLGTLLLKSGQCNVWWKLLQENVLFSLFYVNRDVGNIHSIATSKPQSFKT